MMHWHLMEGIREYHTKLLYRTECRRRDFFILHVKRPDVNVDACVTSGLRVASPLS